MDKLLRLSDNMLRHHYITGAFTIASVFGTYNIHSCLYVETIVAESDTL